MKNITNKAFTLAELIIVITVIGVPAAVLVPVFSNVISKANEKSALSDARNTISTITAEAVDNTDIPQNIVVFVKKANYRFVYHGSLLNGTFTYINDAQTASNLFPHVTGASASPVQTPEPTPTPEQAREVTVTITDNRNGDSSEITYSMTGDTISARLPLYINSRKRRFPPFGPLLSWSFGP